MRKILLGCGAVAGPLYVTVSLTEALTREGFDLTKHAWSQLALGSLGWIHIANLILTGLLVIAAARALKSGLIAIFGLGMVAAGIFKVDPPGSPEQATISWHGMLHFLAGGIGFICLAAACFVVTLGWLKSWHKTLSSLR